MLKKQPPWDNADCPSVPTVFDNYSHIFIRQTFRTGLQTPSGHSSNALRGNDEFLFREVIAEHTLSAFNRSLAAP